MKKENNKKIEWYDSGNIITNLIIGIIILIIVFSQSFAIKGELSLTLFGSIINHNTVYLLSLVYFIFLKTHFGKKYFNYLNVFLIFVYFIVTVTSFLTVVQSFSLNTVLTFIINFVFEIYLIHTMLRDTRFWKEFRLDHSPFNELNNEWYFNAILVLAIFLLVVNLISTVIVRGIMISILDTLYILLLGRYIYLYCEYLNYNKKDVNNSGNFDEIRENLRNTVEETTDKIVEATKDMQDKVSDYIEDMELDKKFDEVKEKVVKTTKDVQDKVSDYIEEKELDKKVDEVKEKVVKTTKDVKDKVNDYIEEKELDKKVDEVKEKVVKTTKDVKDKVNDYMDKKNDKTSSSKKSKTKATKTSSSDRVKKNNTDSKKGDNK